MENDSDKQLDNNSKPWLWKKGQSGNLKGRPKGSTMKEYARDYLSKLTDEERDEWLEGIPKIEIFRMAEGNPKQDMEAKLSGDLTINIVKYEGSYSAALVPAKKIPITTS